MKEIEQYKAMIERNKATDIVERLRACKMSTVPFGMALEAADEIERLRAEVTKYKNRCTIIAHRALKDKP